jgi:pilus assembly protein Flp/PilA
MTLRRTTEDRGASAVEYGLLVSGIAAVIFVAVTLLGSGNHSLFGKSCSTIVTTAFSSSCPN